jgi:hypothetical protein
LLVRVNVGCRIKGGGWVLKGVFRATEGKATGRSVNAVHVRNSAVIWDVTPFGPLK